MTSEAMEINNDRRKKTSSLCNAIRERIVNELDGSEDYFCIDSKPIEVCRFARAKCCTMGKAILRKHLQLDTVLHREYIITDINCMQSVG